MKRTSQGGDKRVISSAMRAIDIWTAILLLTGQVTTGGVFISSGAIWFSLLGPIFGNVRYEGKTPAANVLLDGVDVILAFLLILGQITNTGPWITTGRFNLVVSGPALGNPNVPVPAGPSETSKKAQVFFSEFCQEIIVREMSKGRS
jgi:hypothetical protein